MGNGVRIKSALRDLGGQSERWTSWTQLIVPRITFETFRPDSPTRTYGIRLLLLMDMLL